MEHLKTCPVCGKDFKTKYGQRKYCGNTCEKKAALMHIELRRSLKQGSTTTPEARQKHDPYEFVHKMDEHLQANGGVYSPRKGWGY